MGSSGTTAGDLARCARPCPFGAGPDIPLYAFDTFGTDYPVQARERIMERAEECWASAFPAPEDAGEGCCASRHFAGPGYSRPYPGMIQAVRLVAP